MVTSVIIDNKGAIVFYFLINDSQIFYAALSVLVIFSNSISIINVILLRTNSKPMRKKSRNLKSCAMRVKVFRVM